jgi:putative two-component system response regulator
MQPFAEVLECAMAAKDPYTVGHLQRVTHISLALARDMGLKAPQIDNLEMAARLHDFGKMSIPIGILSKPGKLSGPEMAIVRNHPATGADMLKPLPLPASTFMTIMQHHERLNGSGYPFGLSGNDILLEAKILGVADVVEAIASHRPYRPSLGMAAALGEITGNQGILYDPSVVDACARLYSRHMLSDFFSF